jgi:endonuclease/exonuclease/phosphatase (EEP) superfamily protein YafD
MQRSDLARKATTAVFAATILISIPLVLGFFADRHPAFDSIGHFRSHLAVLLAAGGLLLLASRHWKHGLLAIALGAAALWTTLSSFSVPGKASATAGTEAGNRAVYRLMQLNLRFDNPTPEKVLSLIGRVKPDVITLDEVSAAWQTRLQQISAMYPFAAVCPSSRPFGGTAILSRRPIALGGAGTCLSDGSLAMLPVDLGGHRLDVSALHLTWPWPFKQAAQIEALAGPLAVTGQTALLAGDLNAATWSAAVRRVEAASGLTHIVGIGPSWLDRRLPDALRPYAGLPIDQVFAKGDIAIRSAKTLESVGSDHLPVLVEFSLLGGAKPEDNAVTATAMVQFPD